MKETIEATLSSRAKKPTTYHVECFSCTSELCLQWHILALFIPQAGQRSLSFSAFSMLICPTIPARQTHSIAIRSQNSLVITILGHFFSSSNISLSLVIRSFLSFLVVVAHLGRAPMAENIREKIEIALKFYRAGECLVDCSVVVVAIAIAAAASHCCCCSCCCCCCCRATWKCHCFAQRSEKKTKIYESFSMFFFTRDQKKQEQQPARGSVKCKRLSTEKVHEQAEGQGWERDTMRSYGW